MLFVYSCILIQKQFYQFKQQQIILTDRFFTIHFAHTIIINFYYRLFGDQWRLITDILNYHPLTKKYGLKIKYSRHGSKLLMDSIMMSLVVKIFVYKAGDELAEMNAEIKCS